VRRVREEDGVALIMIIGVVAALAVMASTLVLLTVNASGNTSRDRARAQAFNVAEGLVDYTLGKLGSSWPTTADPAIDTSDTSPFVAQFSAATTAGKFTISNATVTLFDDVDTDDSGFINRLDGVPYDKNLNNKLWIETQATVNGEKARIQVETQRSMLQTLIPRGIAVATNGNIKDPNSGANSDGYAISAAPPYGYVDPSQTTYLSLLAGGTEIDGGTTYGPNPPDGQFFGQIISPATVPSGVQTRVVDAANAVVTPAILQSIITSAKMTNKWYSDIDSEQSAGAQPITALNSDAALSGVVVVETTGGYKITSNVDINSVEKPGVLLVIGPHTMYPTDSSKVGTSTGLDMAGSAIYYGLVYTDGTAPDPGVKFTGNMTVSGMVVSQQYVKLNGSRCVAYNDNVITNLNSVIPVMAQIVPNTWRQIQPTPLP
jgi:hypothetical protein